MLQSKRSIPHFTYVENIDVTEMVALREELNRQYAVPSGELSPLALTIRAIVRAVADFPQVNGRFGDEAGVLTLHDAVHLGAATLTDGGLMVPVVRQAQTLNLWACTEAIAQVAAKARAGKATRDELSGSTLTVTSLGKLGGIVTTPVINHLEVAIVGINRIVPWSVGARRHGAGAADDEPLGVLRSPGGGWGGRGGVHPAREAVPEDASDAVH